MRALYVGLAASLATLGGLTAALSADFLHSRWSDFVSSEPTEQAVFAQQFQYPAIDAPVPVAEGPFADLLRIPDAELRIAPTVSQDILTSSTLRKIGYGRVETVNIVVTASGVYSSDAVASPHVLYPGVELEREDTATVGDFFMALIDGRWTPVIPAKAGSFVTYGSGFGISYRTDGKTTCISGDGYFGCL